jgi:hypothetical protein
VAAGQDVGHHAEVDLVHLGGLGAELERAGVTASLAEGAPDVVEALAHPRDEEVVNRPAERGTSGQAEQPAGGQIGLQAAPLVVDDQNRELGRNGGRTDGAGELRANATHGPHPR